MEALMKLLTAILVIVGMLILPLAACTVEVKLSAETESAPAPTATVSATDVPSEPTAEPSPSPSPTAEPTSEPSPEPTVSMYTSYADLVSFDPFTGVAQFDYWEMLKGDEAVEWLVDHEGYSLADAQAEVDNYADSEYIKKNTNPQLRAIDLSSVPLRMMFHPDGTMLTGAEPIATTFYDFCGLYAAHPDLVLHSFFYRVIVNSGGEISVDQVFWP